MVTVSISDNLDILIKLQDDILNLDLQDLSPLSIAELKEIKNNIDIGIMKLISVAESLISNEKKHLKEIGDFISLIKRHNFTFYHKQNQLIIEILESSICKDLGSIDNEIKKQLERKILKILMERFS